MAPRAPIAPPPGRGHTVHPVSLIGVTWPPDEGRFFFINNQATSVDPPHDTTQGESLTSIKDTATLILRAPQSAPYRPVTTNNLNNAFSAKSTDNPHTTMDKIYMFLTEPDLPGMQENYDILAAVTKKSVSTTLQTFSNNPEAHCFLVCTLDSPQHPDPCLHCLNGIQVLEDPPHPLCCSIIV